jgi:hypothetical protein
LSSNNAKKLPVSDTIQKRMQDSPWRQEQPADVGTDRSDFQFCLGDYHPRGIRFRIHAGRVNAAKLENNLRSPLPFSANKREKTIKNKKQTSV